jgi:uncharacterized protein YjbI with pentapeptide repeats
MAHIILKYDYSKPTEPLKPASENIYYKLALKGKETWNRWIVSAIDPDIARLHDLPECAPLSAAEVKALCADLGIGALPNPHEADFSYTHFDQEVNFSGFVFTSENTVSPYPRFFASKFASKASFGGCYFTHGCSFAHAEFMQSARFSDSTFGPIVSFHSAKFHTSSDFRRTKFCGEAIFQLAKFEGICSFSESIFKKVADFSGLKDGVSGEYFGEHVDFSGATFDAVVIFDNRLFRHGGDFSYAVFKSVPQFYNSTFHENIKFYNAIFEVFSERNLKNYDEFQLYDVARAVRVLTLKCRALNAYDDEMRFFSYEMRAKEYLEKGLNKVAIKAYRIFSNFGVSIARPFIALFCAFLCGGLYNCLWWLIAGVRSCSCIEYGVADVLAFTAVSSLPFVGQTKLATDGFQCLVNQQYMPVIYSMSVLQGLISTLLIFLIGLGVRNKFRIK